jgi:hypothetical protein
VQHQRRNQAADARACDNDLHGNAPHTATGYSVAAAPENATVWDDPDGLFSAYGER